MLIHFLNELLSEEGKRIKDLQFKNNEQTIDNEEDRKVIFDFYCEDENGNYFIVEIQRNKPKFFKERMLYYASKAIVAQGQKGNWGYTLNPVYIIGIMDFNYSQEHVIEYYSLIGKNSRNPYSECLKFVTIELGNFTKGVHELKTNMDKWLFLLKNLYKLVEVPDTLKEHIYMKIVNLSEYAALSKPEQISYDRSLKIERDYNSVMSYQKELAWEEGLSAGKEEGMKMGKEEGMKEGKREGMKEGKREGIQEGIKEGAQKGKSETIKLLHKNGMKIDEIQCYTGYALSEIELSLSL